MTWVRFILKWRSHWNIEKTSLIYDNMCMYNDNWQLAKLKPRGLNVSNGERSPLHWPTDSVPATLLLAGIMPALSIAVLIHISPWDIVNWYEMHNWTLILSWNPEAGPSWEIMTCLWFSPREYVRENYGKKGEVTRKIMRLMMSLKTR